MKDKDGMEDRKKEIKYEIQVGFGLGLSSVFPPKHGWFKNVEFEGKWGMMRIKLVFRSCNRDWSSITS